MLDADYVLAPETSVQPAFSADPAEPSRLFDREGRTIRADTFVLRLLASIGSGTTVQRLLDAAAEPEVTYAALCVLAVAGMLRVDEVPRFQAVSRTYDGSPDTPLVTAIVVNYNGVEDLPRLLHSIRRQEYPQIQTIVVDNDSRDGSLDLLREFSDEVEVIVLKENVGFAGALNAGVRNADGKYIATLNTDLELPPDAMSAWIAKALQRPDAAAVAPKMMLRRHPRFINSLGNSVLAGGWGSDNFIGVLDVGQFDDIEHVFSACFGAALLSRDALDIVGPVDPGYFLYYEDSDWCYRAWRQGFSIVTAPECRVIHAFGASIGTAGELFKLRLVAGNRLRFVIQNLSGQPFWQHFARAVLADFKAVSSATVKRRDYGAASAYLRAYADLARDVRSLLRMRHRRQDPSSRMQEPDWTLNVAPTPAASIADEPLISADVVRHHYVPLFRLYPAAGRSSSATRAGGGAKQF